MRRADYRQSLLFLRVEAGSGRSFDFGAPKRIKHLGDRPLVPKRVFQPPVKFAPELLRQRNDGKSSRIERLSPNRFRIRDLKMQRYGRSAQPIGVVEFAFFRRQLGDFIHEDKDRSKYQHSYVQEPAGPGCGDPCQFSCSKSPSVKGNGGMGVRDCEDGRQPVRRPFGDGGLAFINVSP